MLRILTATFLYFVMASSGVQAGQAIGPVAPSADYSRSEYTNSRDGDARKGKVTEEWMEIDSFSTSESGKGRTQGANNITAKFRRGLGTTNAQERTAQTNPSSETELLVLITPELKPSSSETQSAGSESSSATLDEEDIASYFVYEDGWMVWWEEDANGNVITDSLVIIACDEEEYEVEETASTDLADEP